ncbi:MAG: gliding motility-associated C-terminal domain-containing protein [Saprospiraceae bacterium]|nr:gliding motility-associated C-terminal domain-containing protein [Saprospiraceae bacterium]
MKKQLHLPYVILCALLFFRMGAYGQCPGPGIASISFNVLAAPAPTITGTTQICPGGSTILSVPGSFSSYNWGGAGSGSASSLTATAPGTYVVTVTNAAGCTGTASVAVTQLAGPTPNIVQATYQCNGQRTLNAGSGFSSYSWSAPGGSSATLTVSSPGLYTVTVTAANGCTGTDDINVTIPPPPTVSISTSGSFCQGSTTQLSATPGLSSYAWSAPGGSGATLNVSNSGTYTVTATDAFGCTVTNTATVTTLPAPTPTISGTTSFCAGGNTILNSGTGFNAYAWSGGNGNSQSITVSNGGTYTVTVTAANGCTGTASQSVNVVAAPAPNIVAQPYACNGQFTLNAGTGFATYAWSNPGGNSASLTVNNSGLFTVTVTNALGCSGTDNINVNIPSPPSVSISGPGVFCQGSSVVLSATPGLSAYIWTGNNSGPNFTAISAGTYMLTATDAFGCTTTSSATVSVLPAPSPVIVGNNTICSGSGTTFSVNTSFNAYQWSGGNGNNQSITISNAGTYTVTVTAANGCTNTASRVLTVNASPSPNITEQPYQCDGQLVLTAGGNFNTYNWSTAQSIPSITVVNNSTYSVTVTNAAGCTGSDTYAVTIPIAPSVTISGNSLICPGASTVLNATVGYGSYQWSGSPVNSSTRTVNAAGLYTVTVTDAQGCTASNQFTVNALVAPNPNIAGPAAICPGSSATFTVPGIFSAYQWSNSTNASSITVNTAGTYTVTVTAANGCTGTDTQTLTLSNTLQPQIVAQPYLCDGQFTLDAGAGFATYNWNNSAALQTNTVNTSGTYTVTVTETGGCTGTASFTVNIPTPPAASVSGGSTVCPGTAVNLAATPGFSNYAWSNGPLTANVNVTAPATYVVTVTDAVGCTTTATATVANFVAPVAGISGPITICTNSTALYSASPGFNAYQWSTGNQSADISVNTADTYTVTVTDNNGCTASASQSLLVLDALQPQISPQPYACNGQITLEGSAGFTAYAWSNGETTAAATALQSGAYTLTVTGSGGCTGTANVSVTVPAVPQTTVNGGGTVCPGSTTTLSAGAGFVSYQWSNAELVSSILVSNPTTYTVTVTDNNGCTATASAVVANFPQPMVSINGSAEICAGSTTTLSASNGFASYQWSNGPLTASISVDSVSNYMVTATDANGCTATANLTTSAVTALNPAIVVQPYQCTGTLTLDAGPGFSTYTWSGGGVATASFSVSSSGTYVVTVTNATGCTGTAASTVSVPVLSQAQINGGGNVCPGQAATLTATAGFVDYQWNSNETTPSITTLSAGLYTVTVTDSDGCTATASASVENFAQPVVVITGNTQICSGSTTTLSASGVFNAYQWSNGLDTPTITVDSVSNYMVTITDGNGCTASNSLATTLAPPVSPAIVVQPYQCTATLTLDAGAGFSTYNWSGASAVSQTVSVSNSGTYTVTVTDVAGCTGTATQAVIVPAQPVATVTGGGNVCPGDAATLTATSGFVSYAWTGTGAGASFSTSTPATYTVTVTDDNGCTTTASATLGNFPQPVVNISGNSLICPNSSTTLNASSGFAAYAWSNGQSNAAISVDTADVFVVTVTDANGCNATASLSTTLAPPLSPAIAVQPYQCAGTLTLDAGAGFSNYNWSGGATLGQTLTVSNSGTYTVTVADASGCTSTAVQTITVPVLPVVTVSGGSSVCPGVPVTLSASAGFSNYHWSQSGNTASITATTPTTYAVTVTDGSGCTATATAVVGNFPAPTVAIAGDNQFCAGSSSTLSATSGFNAYQWSGNQNTAGISVDSAGNYSVTVTDNNGCTATAARTVVVGALPVPTIAVTSNYGGFATPCAEQALASAAASVNNGTAPFSFVWSGGGGNSAAVSNLLPGPYTLTVTDALGCTGTATVSLTAAPPLAPELDIVPPTCETLGQVTVLLAQAPATATTITIDNGSPESLVDNFFTINNLEGGVYAIRLADSFGCTTELDAEVPSGELLQTQVGDTLEVLRGVPVNLSVTLPFTPVSISWTSATPVNLSCADCLNPRVVVDATTTLLFNATTLGGCIATGQFLLQTKKQSSIFAPNVITPGSAGNDRFTIFGDAFLTNIQVLEIFDRWGNQMAALQNIAPNDPNIGWDGRYRNQDVTPGVYVWWARLSYADGTSEIMEGEVAVVR